MVQSNKAEKIGIDYDPENKYHRLVKTIVITIFSLSSFVLVWWWFAVLLQNPYLPIPQNVWISLQNLLAFGDPVTGLSLWQHVDSSLRRFAGGFIIAFSVAVPLGLIMGYSRFSEEFTSPIIEVLRPIAPMAWAPLFILSMGTVLGPMMVVFIGVFFPVLSNTIFGVKKIDTYLVDAAKTLGASNLQIFYKVMIPCTIPYIMNGVKIGLGIGWMCIVAAEMIVTFGGGIGYFILIQSEMSRWGNVFVGLLVVSALGILTTGIADRIHRTISLRMGLE